MVKSITVGFGEGGMSRRGVSGVVRSEQRRQVLHAVNSNSRQRTSSAGFAIRVYAPIFPHASPSQSHPDLNQKTTPQRMRVCRFGLLRGRGFGAVRSGKKYGGARVVCVCVCEDKSEEEERTVISRRINEGEECSLEAKAKPSATLRALLLAGARRFR